MMKSFYRLFAALLLLTLPAIAAAEEAAADAGKSLEQIATEVRELLARERVRNQFDLLRRLRDYGVTWQPSLLAPNNLVDVLDREKLNFYAGVKLSDALYAATFMQRQALLDALQTIEAIQDKLDLRGAADLSGSFFATLRQAAATPDLADVNQLLERLADDYVKDVPALMSNPDTADYLIDSLYGFTVTNLYVMGYFFRNDTDRRLRDGMRQQPDRVDWLETLVKVFKAFDRMNETVRTRSETIQKVAVIENMIEVLRDDGNLSDEALANTWHASRPRIVAISEFMMNPYTE